MLESDTCFIHVQKTVTLHLVLLPPFWLPFPSDCALAKESASDSCLLCPEIHAAEFRHCKVITLSYNSTLLRTFAIVSRSSTHSAQLSQQLSGSACLTFPPCSQYM